MDETALPISIHPEVFMKPASSTWHFLLPNITSHFSCLPQNDSTTYIFSRPRISPRNGRSTPLPQEVFPLSRRFVSTDGIVARASTDKGEVWNDLQRTMSAALPTVGIGTFRRANMCARTIGGSIADAADRACCPRVTLHPTVVAICFPERNILGGEYGGGSQQLYCLVLCYWVSLTGAVCVWNSYTKE